MDRRKFNKGTPGNKGGRKLGTGISGKINKAVVDFMQNLMEDEEIKQKVVYELRQLSNLEGWIYIIKDNKTGYYKIGVTQRQNPKERLKLYRAHKMDIDLIYLDKVNYVFELEDILLNMFERVEGGSDWFNLTEKQLIDVVIKTSNFKYPKAYL